MSLRSKKQGAVTVSAEAHMGRVKAMRCVCCELLQMPQDYPTDVHHIREGGEARNDFLVLPLCWGCHQGPKGVHGDRAYLRILKISEWGLLALVIEHLNAQTHSAALAR